MKLRKFLQTLVDMIQAFLKTLDDEPLPDHSDTAPIPEPDPVSPIPARPVLVEDAGQKVRGAFLHVSLGDLEKHLAEPLKAYAKDFLAAGRANKLDPRFLASISMLETGRGTSYAFRKKNNAMGISDRNGAIWIESVPKSIWKMANRLAQLDGPYRGADTIAEIGAIYSPPGASNDPNNTNHGWPFHVSNFYKQFLESGSQPEEPGEVAITPAPGMISLPRENNASLNKFYGKADPNGGFLEWFSFPTDNIRLYSRNGINLSDADGDGRDAHRCHKAIAKRLEAALQEIYDTLGRFKFEKEGWNIYSGCFNYRKKRGGSSLSTHSWGIAIDVNGNENPFKSSKTTFSDTSIDIMEKHGFLSGGRAWGKDWMHFQAAIPHISKGSYYDTHGLPDHIRAI